MACVNFFLFFMLFASCIYAAQAPQELSAAELIKLSPYEQPFTILGLPTTASRDDIRKRFKELALKWHPDRNQDISAGAVFKKINEAQAQALAHVDLTLSEEPKSMQATPEPSQEPDSEEQISDADTKIYEHIANSDLSNIEKLARQLRKQIPGLRYKIKGSHELSPLSYAVNSSTNDAVKALLNAGADPNYDNPLQFAALNISKVSLLLNAGADINAQDEKGDTILMKAVQRGDTNLVKFLLANKADVNLKNKNGIDALSYAPLSVAREAHYEELLNLLLQAIHPILQEHPEIKAFDYYEKYGTVGISKLVEKLKAEKAKVNK